MRGGAPVLKLPLSFPASSLLDIDAEWSISESTGHEYVFVACSFIRAVTRVEHKESAIR